MSKLLITDEQGNLIQERQLDRERLKIGRKADCDIILDHLSVSMEHALVTTLRNDSFIQDVGSTNGVRVNGKLVKSHYLQDGDVINIASFNLKYQHEEWVMPEDTWAPTVAKEPKASSMTVTMGSDQTMLTSELENELGLKRELTDPRLPEYASDLKAVTTLMEAGQGIGALRLMEGLAAGKQIDLTQPVLTLGKPGVQTAVIGKQTAGYFLTYVEGESYPLVNGNEVGATPYHLQNHDIIELGGTRLEFFYK